tara:strand:+ start:404 stop:619 length:216 start_codon:yes stop_codon:yes gene_type:complete
MKNVDGARVEEYDVPIIAGVIFSPLPGGIPDMPEGLEKVLGEAVRKAGSFKIRIVTADSYDHPRLAYYCDK